MPIDYNIRRRLLPYSSRADEQKMVDHQTRNEIKGEQIQHRKDIGDFMKSDKEFSLTVGLRIREIREAYNLTRDQFSEKCDISTSFLADVESGKKGFSSKILFKICSATNVSADYFLFGHENGFEQDMLIELTNMMPKHAKEAGVRIMREYVEVVNHYTQQDGKLK